MILNIFSQVENGLTLLFTASFLNMNEGYVHNNLKTDCQPLLMRIEN